MTLAGGIIIDAWGAAEQFAEDVTKWQNGQQLSLPSFP